MTAVIGALLLLSPSASAASQLDTVIVRQQPHRTPFGVRAGGCTLDVPSGSRIDEIVRDGVPGVLVTRPAAAEGTWESDNDAYFYATPEHCHADMAVVLARRHAMGRGSSSAPPWCHSPPCGRPSKIWTPDNFTCSKLPCDGWIDNAGWEVNGEGKPWPLTVAQFNATFVLPRLPKQLEAPKNCTFNYTDTDSCPGLIWFTGLENSDGWDRLCRWENCSEPHGPLAHMILQPVIEYYDCPHPGDHSFCARSWACCPHNVTCVSTALEGLQPEDEVTATIDVQMGGEPMHGPPYSTVTTSVSHYPNEVASTVLHVHTYTRHFNWADVTHEIYGVAQCSDFASGPFSFRNLSMSNNKGGEIDMTKVKWLTTTTKPCNGSVVVEDHGRTILIEHS